MAGWFGINSIVLRDWASVAAHWTKDVSDSNVAAGQEVEGPVLAAVGRLKLVPQAELPLVLQLQPYDGLTQGTSVLADHTERGTCGEEVRTGVLVLKGPVAPFYSVWICFIRCYTIRPHAPQLQPFGHWPRVSVVDAMGWVWFGLSLPFVCVCVGRSTPMVSPPCRRHEANYDVIVAFKPERSFTGNSFRWVKREQKREMLLFLFPGGVSVDRTGTECVVCIQRWSWEATPNLPALIRSEQRTNRENDWYYIHIRAEIVL